MNMEQDALAYIKNIKHDEWDNKMQYYKELQKIRKQKKEN